jgi:thiamine-phosphate pyrophosphorylase
MAFMKPESIMRRIDNSLYLVISEEFGRGRSAEEIAKAAISGGVDILQLRDKNKSVQELFEIGARILALCKEKNVIFIVNDDPMLAKRIGADGVHLGQDDIERFSIDKARDAVGPNRMIGVSTHSIDQVKKAMGEDIDYIAFGPIFPTKAKNYCLGTNDIRKVMELSRKPVFFIGGIDLSNMDKVLLEGARNIAMIRGITEADDIAVRTRQFKEKLKDRKEADVI